MKIILKLIAITLSPFIIGISVLQSDHTEDVRHGSKTFNPDHLDGAFTGGFGEQSCHSCHFDYDVNMEGGSLTIAGIGDSYQPGEEFEITVTIESEQLEIGGFQLTSRFEDGTQAGDFEWEGNRLMFTPSVTNEVKYLQHSPEGTHPAEEKKIISWTFMWQAPDSSDEPVIFNVAGNAGNLDDSSFGDWIYVKELILNSDL